MAPRRTRRHGRLVTPAKAGINPAKPAAKPANPPKSRATPQAPKPKTPARPSIGKVSGPASNPQRPAPKPSGQPARPSIGNVSGPASSPKRPAPKPSGQFRAPSLPNPPQAPARPAANPATGVGAGMRGGLVQAAAQLITDKTLSPLAFKAGEWVGNTVLKPVGRAIDRAKPRPGGTARTKPQDKPRTGTGRQSRTGKNDNGYTKPPGKAAEGVFAKPSAPAARSGGGGGGGSSSRSGGGGGSSTPSRSSAPAAPRSARSDAPKPPNDSNTARSGMEQWRAAHKDLATKADERAATRGTSKTTNPLMKDFIGRMASGEKASAPPAAPKASDKQVAKNRTAMASGADAVARRIQELKDKQKRKQES